MRSVRIIALLMTWLLSGCKGEPDRITPPSQPAGEEVYPILKTAGYDAVDSILRLAHTLLPQQQTDSAEQLYRQALTLSLEQSYMNGMALAYGNLALCLAQRREFNLAVSYSLKSIRYNTLMRKKDRLALQYMHLSTIYERMGASREIIRLAKDVLPRYDLQNPLHRQYYLTLISNRATAYMRTGNTVPAYLDLQEIIAETAHPDTGTYTILGGAYIGMSILASNLGKYPYALQMATACEKLAAGFSDLYLLSNAWSNKASIYYNTDSLDKALEYAMKSMAVYEDNDRAVIFKTTNLRVIAGVLGKKGAYRQALQYALEALSQDLKLKTQSAENLIKSYTILGNIYAALEEYENAKPVLLKAEAIAAAKSSFKQEQSQIYRLLSDVYKATGAYREAMNYKDRFYSLQDSIAGQDMQIRIEDAEARYKLAEKDRLIVGKELEAQRNLNRQYIWTGISLLMLLTLAGSVLYMKSRSELSRVKGMLEGEEQERKRIARELHDGVVSHLSVVKTSFSNLRDYQNGHEEVLEDAIRQLDQSITELRDTSHNLLPHALLHEGLAATLDDYFHKINASGNIHITLQMVDELPQLTGAFQLNLYRIIQELIQNIIKYAGATRVLVQFNTYTDALSVTVEDNGQGREFLSKVREDGIGLVNLDARIGLLHGEQETESDPGRGTTVYLTFPTGRLRGSL